MQTAVTIRYSGPALDDGRMDVYEASANMIAFSEFMVAAVKITYGDAAEAKAEVSGFAQGSFLTNIVIEVAGSAATVFTALSPDQLWSVVKGAFELWKHLKGESPKKVEHHGVTCAVTNNFGQVYNIRTESLNLVFNAKAAEAAERFVKMPLEKSGYEHLEIQTDGGITVATVDETEAERFKPIGKAVVLTDNTYQMVVHVVGPVFQDGNKWRFSDGEHPFNAAILDSDFLVRVNQGERFGKGDRLLVDMRVVQTGVGMKTSIERHVVKVHQHITPQEQTSLL